MRSVRANLSLERKRRVAAGENQPKAIVGDFARVVIRFLDGRDQPGCGIRFKFFLEPCAAADAIDGLMPGCLDDPSAGEIRDTGNRPLVHSGGKGFLRRLFGHIEVANQPNQGGDDPAPVGAINRVDRYVCVPRAYPTIN